jgi:amino acid adenylation domain-containing protein
VVSEQPVHELFRSSAVRDPDAVAICAADATLTYGELERDANRLAHRLRSLGVDRERLVGLCIDRSAALVVGALGILKSGGAYVALDPRHPPDRLRSILDECGAGVLVSSREAAAALTGSRATFVLLDARDAELERESATAPAVTTDPADLAYVIYTSGSTGAPKGVMVEHGSLSNLVSWHRRAFAITESDRATQVASPAFDAAIWELWPHLAAGSSLHIPPEHVRRDPVAIRDWLVAERITVSFLPTALAEAVLVLEWPPDTALRFLLTGGDTLHHHPPAGLPFTVVNNYGPTEATVVATSGRVRPSLTETDPETRSLPSIGRPISGARIYVVDERLDQVPAGTVGELLIGGSGVARGYLRQPELTARRFIPDPFSGTPARLYRTGDLVRLGSDGELEFCGRRDHQVQIRGNRIELDEIAAVLGRHRGVQSAAVVCDESSPTGPRLVAYVVSTATAPSADALRDHVSAQLPDFMVPAMFVSLDEMPVTAGGKIDRALLRSRAAVEQAPPPGSARPGTELEQMLEGIVAELLERDEVGVDANFFMLGGHSLLGAQVIARIGERLGVDMSLRSLFDNPTVAEMAIEVERLLVAELAAMSDADAARLLATDPATGAVPESP